jgi:hypothetical protein
MGLKVVGSGLGRTGTKSLKSALEMLGVGPCHHMLEVMMNPQSVPLWVDAGEGRPDWDSIFKDYQSAVDYPTCAFWRELTEHYPNAKVLHSTRDPDAWFESTQATIFAPGSLVEAEGHPMSRFFQLVLRDLQGHLHDRAFMIDYFKRHNEEVVRAIPKERLLVYDVREGWEPLCAFLGVPVPAEPFPSENSRQEFKARIEAGVFPLRDPANRTLPNLS